MRQLIYRLFKSLINFLATTIAYLFAKHRREATVLVILILIVILSMNTGVKQELIPSAHSNYCEGAHECYRLDENGNEVIEFNPTLDFYTKWTLPDPIFFTSYNPEVGQTDNSPCIGANGTNLCQMALRGIRTIALSQDLVGRLGNKEYTYGDRVMLYSDNPQCNGIFQIEDTMNKRYTLRGDIFCLDRSCNTSCEATITKL